ncbi:MAG: hypothetical protein ACFWUC_09270 [Oscillospiraceae bacterium]|jgi:hypothetical protein
MKHNARMDTQRTKQHPVVTGSRGRKTWDDPDNMEEELYEMEDLEPEDKKLRRKGSARLLTTIQIIACTAILVGAVVLRIHGGTVYQNARKWYFDSLNDSIVAQSQMDNIKHVVIDLWSTLSESRGESSSQVPQVSSSVSDNGANFATSQPQENASDSTSPAEQPNSSTSSQIQQSSSNTSSAVGNEASSPVSS